MVFGYGAIMHHDDMRELAPNARFHDIGQLSDWRIGVTTSGWLGITREPGAKVHGAVFTMGPGDEQRLDAFEAIDRGLYTKQTLTVNTPRGRVDALVYEPTEPLDGTIRVAYLERCLEAARNLGLPTDWLNTLALLQPQG